jgi:hydroxypyruvate reductase
VREWLSLRDGTLHVGAERFHLGRGRIAMVAAGKAAGRMAGAAERILAGELSGAIAVDTTATTTLEKTTRYLARHPVPDSRGERAARAVRDLAASLGSGDLLLVLLSGGASALLAAPVEGVPLRDKAAATTALIRSGASIGEINAVRKHLSTLKGGQLARIAAPARIVTLVLSDVVGDDLATIASGPTAPDPTSYRDACAVVQRYGLRRRIPASVRRHLDAGARGAREETPKPGDAVFRGVHHQIVGNNRLALEAAAAEARRRGLRPRILTSRLEGEAREVARVLVAMLREHVEQGPFASAPVCLLAGGETTVSVHGSGRGGRNQELVAAAAESLATFPGPALVASLATDGVDGNSDAAGGFADDRSLARAAQEGLSFRAALAANDSSTLLGALGDRIQTGPTGTNVMDVTVLLGGGRTATGSARQRKL